MKRCDKLRQENPRGKTNQSTGKQPISTHLIPVRLTSIYWGRTALIYLLKLMCFGPIWSAMSMSICGIVTLLCLAYGVDIRVAAAPIFLFVKEWIQYQQYKDLTCNRRNKILSTLSWVHISFQPLFINLLFSYFAPNRRREYSIVLWLCVIFGIFNVFRLKELRGSITSECKQSKHDMCQPESCSYLGKHHLAYGFQLQSADYLLTPSAFTYVLLTFAPVFILGPRLLGGLHLAVALFAVYISGFRGGEAAAIWCLNSFWVSFAAIFVIMQKSGIGFKRYITA